METTMEVHAEEMSPFHKHWPKYGEIFDDEVNDGIEIYGDELHCLEKIQNAVEGASTVEDDRRQRTQVTERNLSSAYKLLDGKDVNDIPAVYAVPTLQPFEFAAVGVWIDKRIVPGFKYRVRSIESEEYKDDFLFNGEGLTLQSIGCGYSRRITFVAPPGNLNNNGNYFYSDSRMYGFAFQPQLLSIGEKFTIYDISHRPIGHVEILKIQYPQEEISHQVLDDKSVEKSARVRALAKVEWFDRNEVCVSSIRGTVISVKRKGELAQVCRIVGVSISGQTRRNFTLFPGIDNKKRCITVSGAACNDVPINYNVVGLETFELPVIGTYVDPRILPGFYYKVRPINSKNYLFDGQALKLLSIGTGYSKRLTFEPFKNCLNSNQNYFWTDSMPSGFGFELRAVHCDTDFKIYVKDQCLGHSSVFRVEYPQYEEKQSVTQDHRGTVVTKYVHVEITCLVTLCWPSNNDAGDTSQICDGRVMRISGMAVLEKTARDKEARLLRIQDIGLDSQLNFLFLNEHDDRTNLIFVAQ